MWLQLVYFAYLIACCGYCIARGGRDEYLGVAIVCIATLLSLDPVKGQTDWADPDMVLALVDSAAFLAALAIALRSDRFWPIWFAGFCLVGAATHLSTGAMTVVAPRAYAWVEGFWAYPAIACIVVGAYQRHRRPLPD